ncbi:unnamed protein product [Protopolystoma xenopodis]|uniref:Uncharacterized protein n=1 Tax=Protopolystoma xenopodis TaxID=117903 RepID=A0A448WCT2_9PLAT|nr:unnamed protein product [Protopolystoma xenopodis]
MNTTACPSICVYSPLLRLGFLTEHTPFHSHSPRSSSPVPRSNLLHSWALRQFPVCPPAHPDSEHVAIGIPEGCICWPTPAMVRFLRTTLLYPPFTTELGHSRPHGRVNTIPD